MAALVDRLSFLQKLPTLMKGTSDDEVPCPGYLFQDIAKISQESDGSRQCLLEYLLNRLQNKSCHVKLKVLKILFYVCTHGSPRFMLELRRNVTFIQEAAVFSGPPDPFHGNSLYQKVRAAAQDLTSALFSDALLSQSLIPSSRTLPQAGMGSEPTLSATLQGFGYTQEQISCSSVSESLLSTIQKAAEVMANAVLPGPLSSEPQEEAYQPVTVPSTADCCRTPKQMPSLPTHSLREGGSHRPGLAGGGWEENDSGHSSQNSSQETCDPSRTSGSCSKCGSDSHSAASRETSDVMDRVEAINLNDCLQERNLVNVITKGETVFLTQEEAQHFLKGCALLNCEAVLELLNHSLEDENTCVRMRALCAISSLMCTDLLSHDQMFAVIKTHLQQLSQGSPGPVANKATKILRQFEALSRTKLPSESLHHDPSSCCALEGSRRLAADLLTDTFPMSEKERVLQPLPWPPLLLGTSELLASKEPQSDELTAMSPSRCQKQGSEGREMWEQLDRESANCTGAYPEQYMNQTVVGSSDTQILTLPSEGAQNHSLSLFEGMNLVLLSGVREKSSVAAELEQQQQPHACTGISNTSQKQPSAFSFLNI